MGSHQELHDGGGAGWMPAPRTFPRSALVTGVRVGGFGPCRRRLLALPPPRLLASAPPAPLLRVKTSGSATADAGACGGGPFNVFATRPACSRATCPRRKPSSSVV